MSHPSENAESAVLRIPYLREVAGKLLPYLLILSKSDRRQLYNGLDKDELARQNTRKTAQPAEGTYTVNGVTLRRREDGVSVVVAVSAEAEKLHSVLRPEAPCPFPGCEELRRRYLERKAELDEDPSCSDCAHGALMREILDEASKLMAV